jgi:hypothetical protein
MHLKNFNLKRVSLIIIWLLLVWFAIVALIAPKQDGNNTTVINGHFYHIEKGVGTGRASGCIWYDLYLQESQQYYRISADNSECFSYDSLQNNIKAGDPIQLYISKPIPFFSIVGSMVVSVKSNNQEYLSFSCINEKIEDERVGIPLCCLGLGLFTTLLMYKKEVGLWLKNR